MSSDVYSLRRNTGGTGWLARRNAGLLACLASLAGLLTCLPAELMAAPVITTQPQGSTNTANTSVSFSVVATGTGTLRYQWYFNQTNAIFGATTTSLSYSNVVKANQGIYTVVVTNTTGAVTSAPAILIVIDPPEVLRQPTNVLAAVGGTATFRLTAIGDPPLTYQWFFNIIDPIPDATNNILILSNLQPSQAGTYQAEITNPADTVNTVEAVLTIKFPPTIFAPPASQTVTQGNTATFAAGVAGDPPFAYQWYFNTTNLLAGATNSTLFVSNAQPSLAGGYTLRAANEVGSATSSVATLTVLLPPVILQSPTNRTVAVGSTASFSVSAAGDGPLAYQWYFNQTNPLNSATASTLNLLNVQPGDAGSYSVRVSNNAGAITSSVATLTVITPPNITQHPTNRTVAQGQTATFSVVATGVGPITYQWFFNSTNRLNAATSSTFTLLNVQPTNAGSYSVVVSNLAGAVVSQAALLSVETPPTILQQPVSRAVVPGGTASFSVTAQGAAPFRYQWFFNNATPLLDATNAILTVTNVQSANVGSYSVRVTNLFGFVISASAGLVIKQPPVIVQAPASLTVTQGSAAAFTVVASGDGPFGYRWFFNETNIIPAPNSATLTISSAQPTNAGGYSVLVTNDAASALSTAATLTVRVPPFITFQPQNLAVTPGSSATFTVAAGGDQPLQYQWFFESLTAIPDATNASYTINNAQAASDGSYSVRVSNGVGSTNSAAALLRIRNLPTIVQAPSSLTVTQGQTAVFTVQAGGDGPFTYQWFFNATNPIPSATGPSLAISNTPPSAAGNYSVRVTNLVGFVVSPEASLTVHLIPTITRQPTGLTAGVGGTAAFGIEVTGESPFSYQWRFNQTNHLPGATSAALTLTNLQLSNAGLYSVIVSNAFGFAVSDGAPLIVKIPPSIVQPPASVISTQGLSAAFTVVAAGDTPLAYQWFHQATNLVLQATNATLVLNALQPSDAGEYSVRVTNIVGSVQSAAATLTVALLPEITQHPASLTITQGNTAVFTVAATSDLPLDYQWRHNGTNLASATGTILTLSLVQTPSAGLYDVLVSNARGTVTSAVAVLTVRGIDFGDAPDPNYPTLLSSDGPRHILLPGVFLGRSADPEPDGQPTAGADGDDTASIDDDDGIRLLSHLRVGQQATIEVVASTNGLLNAWVDFHPPIGWGQAAEQVFTNQPLAPGTNVLMFDVPTDALIGTAFARFRFSTASDLSFTGLAPDGEVEDYALTVAPTADLEITQSTSISSVTAGNNATFTIHATNRGPSAATGVTVLNQLSSRSAFVSVATTQGACSNSGGTVTCNLGSLPSGSGAEITLIARIGQGTNTTLASVTANEFDPGMGNNLSAMSVAGTRTLPQFANGDLILMPLPDSGPASPYPANVIVSGATAAVHKVMVTLRNVNHDVPDDMDILLVGPGGQKVMLMSDAGANIPLFDVSVTLDDEAEAVVPDNVLITTGTYRPANYAPAADPFSAPAPSAPYQAALSVFNGTDPNGAWSLYVMDDSLDNGGSDVPGFIADGWTLTIVTADALADLSITQSAQPATVVLGDTLRYTITITNQGPANSLASVQDVLPAGITFVSATPSQGTCAIASDTFTCQLGSLPAGGVATVTLDVIPTRSGPLTNTVAVSGNEIDLSPANNSSTLITTVQPVADLALAVSTPQSNWLAGRPVNYQLSLSNSGPDTATAVVLTNVLPAGMTFLSAVPSQGQCTNENGQVRCSLGNLAAGGFASIQITGTPSLTGLNSNFARVVSIEMDRNSTNNSASHLLTVNSATDLALGASPDAANVAVGRDFITLLTVSNLGPGTTDALLVDALPATVSFVSATTARGSCNLMPGGPAGSVQCQFTSLAPGESATVILVLRTSVLGTLTNLAQLSGSIAELEPANNSATNIAFVVAAADLALTLSDRPDPVFIGDDLIYTLAVTNQGPNTAVGVALTNMLPPGVSFVSAVLGQGSCSRAGNEVSCNLGSLASGAGVSVALLVRPALAGFITNRASVASQTVDASPANNTATEPTRVLTSSGNFASATPVLTPVFGPANPYPSTIFVSGLTASVFHVRMTLNNLSHSYADDLDILLVGPGGQTALLMSDCGGDFSLGNVSLTFDDDVVNALPDSTPIFSGVVRPANYGTEADLFPLPAPAGPYGTNLAVFNDTNPNGVWSLYIIDDADKDSGLLAGGWSLSFTTLNPLADVALGQAISQGSGNGTATPLPLTDPVRVAVGSNVVFTYTVTNRGPAAATNVRLTNSLPSFLASRSVVSSQGACGFDGDTLVCGLGAMPAGAVATVAVTVTSLVTGSATNSLAAGSDFTDLSPANNTSRVGVVFELPPIITLQPLSRTVPAGANVQFSTTAVGAEPLQYQWRRNGVDVPGANSPNLALNNVSPADLGSYRLRVSNLVGGALSDEAMLFISGPPSVSPVGDRSIDEDTDTGLIPFVVQDFDTAVETLALLGASSNPALVPPGGIVFGGAGTNRTVRVTPAPNQFGDALIGIIVTDTTGAATTNRFTLTVRPVIDPIQIVTQPQGSLVVTGSTASFSVSAASTLPLSYQWQRNGQGIAGATAASLSLPNVQLTNAGTYRVLISNADTNVLSAAAELRVVNIPDPRIVSITQNGASVTISFTTIAGPSYTLEYKNAFSDTAWTTISSATGNGNTMSITDPTATNLTRFYRIKAN